MQSPEEHPVPKAFEMNSRRWVVAALVIAGVAIVVLFALLRPAPPAPFVVLHGPFHFPASFRDWVERYIPNKASWRWVWKTEQRALGSRKPVLIQANIVSFADSPPTLLTNSTLGPPNFSDTNGLCIWLLSSNQVRALRGELTQTPGAETLMRPRISTAEGIEASMFVNGSFLTAAMPPASSIPIGSVTLGSPVPANTAGRFGTAFGCCVRFRRNSTDFFTHITTSEWVTKDNDAIETNGYGPYGYAPPTITVLQTNLETALRLQLPKGNGVFFLDQSHHEPLRKNIGVLIDPL
jgi:hypothetical protein